MKKIIRYFLINLAALWISTQIIPGLTFTGGVNTLVIGGFAFAIINFLLVPLLKILFLPLNLLTLGLFSWIVNVLALYALTTVVSGIHLTPFTFEGAVYNGFTIPAVDMNIFWVAVAASFIIGIITQFLQWLVN